MSARYPQQLVRLAFAREVDAEELPGFAVYRAQIRARLGELARWAYRRTWELLGPSACDESFARYLEASPPRSPLVREVVHGFAAFACADALAERAPYARDLLRFEAAKWEVADVAVDAATGALDALDFARVPVLEPTLRVLPLAWTVDDPDVPPTRAAHALLLYRRAADDALRWYRVEALWGELLARVARRGESFGLALPVLLAERGVAADPELLNSLASFLATAVERGVIRGVPGSVG